MRTLRAARTAVAGLAFAALAASGCNLGRMRAEAVADVSGKLGRPNILLMDDAAQSFGLESWGHAQLRGNGCLAATADTLLFRQWSPARDFRIPRAAIVAVDTPTWHLGKSHFHPLLHVAFTNDAGQRNSIAWDVRDLTAWLRLLR
jgi:hypothetical protein